MIRNQQQLRIAQRRYQEFIAAAHEASEEDRGTYLDVANDIKDEIDEYISISVGNRDTFEITSVDDLADALIKARIARRRTQADLAKILGVSEQMVQRDEAGGYERATLVRLADVADALEYKLIGRLAPASADEDHFRIAAVTSAFRVHSQIGQRMESGFVRLHSTEPQSVASLQSSLMWRESPADAGLCFLMGGGIPSEHVPHDAQSDAVASVYKVLNSETPSQ